MENWIELNFILGAMLFVAGILAGLINVLAGGGTAIPIVILTIMGIPANVANAAVRPGMLCAAITSAYGFIKSGAFDWRTALKLGLFTIPGGILGGFSLYFTPGPIFQKILAIVIIIVGLSLFIPMKTDAVMISGKWTKRIAMIFVGIYGGFIQAGVGLVQMFVFRFFGKMQPVELNGYKMIHNIMFSFPALILFIALGMLDGLWLHALIVVAGCIIGGKLSVIASVKCGTKAIKIATAVILVFMVVMLVARDNVEEFLRNNLVSNDTCEVVEYSKANL